MTAQEVLENVTTELVVDIMEECGSPIMGNGTTSDGVPYLIFLTVCHHGDPTEASPKLYYYTESKDFMCYTNCGRMTFFNAIMAIKGFSTFKQSLYFVAEKAGIDLRGREKSYTPVDKEALANISRSAQVVSLENNIDTIDDIPEDKYFDNKVMDQFEERPYQGWLDEGISAETMKKFNIRWDGILTRVIIPHYIKIDGEEKLVGIKRRSLTREDLWEAKYKPITVDGILYAHNVRKMFYGLYLNEEAIKRQREAVIVESEKSVLKSDSWYGNNSTTIAVNGFNIFPWHIKKLTELGVETIYLAFDNDVNLTEPGKERDDYTKKMINIIQKCSGSMKVRVICDPKCEYLGIKDSPFDQGKDIYEILKKAAVTGEDYIERWEKI